MKTKRARRLLNPDEETKILGEAVAPAALSEPAAPESVTEHTTLKLDASRAKNATKVTRR